MSSDLIVEVKVVKVCTRALTHTRSHTIPFTSCVTPSELCFFLSTVLYLQNKSGPSNSIQ